jgi:hypothetical protein
VTTQPADQAVAYGQNASFTAAATGTAPVTVQWQVSIDGGTNWTPLAGETNTTLTVPTPPVPASGNKYRAVFTNACGPNVPSNAATLTVNKKPLTVTADAKSREYGDANPTFTFSYSGGFVGSDGPGDIDTPPTCTSTATPSTPVTSTVDITCAGAADNNYTFTYVNGALTITKAPLTVTADDATREYGDANPAFTATLSGFKNGETVVTSGVTGAASCSSSATPSSSVPGPYPITCTIGTLAATNYSFGPFVDGELTVTKAPLTVTADDKTKEYGEANPALTFAYAGFKGTDGPGDLAAVPTCSTTASQFSGVAGSPYPITCAGGDDDNYSFSYVDGELTVTKAPLTVTADDKTKEYGEANPALTFAYAGFKGTDGPGDLAAVPTCSTTASQFSGVAGSPYPITCAGGDDDNYSFSYVDGELTVTKAPLTVTAANQTIISGDPDPVFTFQYSGFKGTDGPSDIDTPPTCGVTGPHSAPGTYPIVCSGGVDDNYSFVYVNGTLTVKKRTYFLVLDEDAVDNGGAPNNFSAAHVNDHIAAIGLRAQLPWFAGNVGRTIELFSGQTGDEGWFALKTIPSSWVSAGPTADGARNLLQAGPGLGSGSNRERWLDKVPNVTPLRATGLKLLQTHQVCAVVWDSDISMGYGPLNGSLKGANLGIVAFEVVSVSRRTGASSSSLPRVTITVLNAQQTCLEPFRFLTDAPAPSSSSAPNDVNP